jgi:hypothetical protein
MPKAGMDHCATKMFAVLDGPVKRNFDATQTIHHAECGIKLMSLTKSVAKAQVIRNTVHVVDVGALVQIVNIDSLLKELYFRPLLRHIS